MEYFEAKAIVLKDGTEIHDPYLLRFWSCDHKNLLAIQMEPGDDSAVDIINMNDIRIIKGAKTMKTAKRPRERNIWKY